MIDKTGTGDYGRANDIAVVWSPTGVPYVVAVMSDRAGGGYDAEPRERCSPRRRRALPVCLHRLVGPK